MTPKTLILGLLAAITLAGCATSKTSIGGNTPSTTGPSAKSIWDKQLSMSSSLKAKGTIRAVRGDHASISSNNAKSFTSATVGQTLAESSIAATGPDSQLDIFLADNGPVIRLTENSQVKFVRLGLTNLGPGPDGKIINTMLDLTKGRLLGNVKKLAPGSSYLVRTRNGLVRIHGTEFTITADGQCEISAGAAELIRGKSHYTVTSGQTQ